MRSCSPLRSTPLRSSTSESCRWPDPREPARRRNLSPSVAVQLRDAGYGAIHVANVGLAAAVDPDIVDHAEAQRLVIVTVDTDFPMLLAFRRATSPSIVLPRGVNELAPDDHAALVIANLPAVTADLDAGAVVSLGPDHVRERTLPLA